MTIFRCDMLAATAFALVPVVAIAQQPSGASCGNVDPAVERACVQQRVDNKERSLAAIYARALAAVRHNFARYGREDSRSNVKYLVSSQAAWKQFVDNDCKVQAAFGGGSNASISDREMDCYDRALDERAAFLGQLANGSFGTG